MKTRISNIGQLITPQGSHSPRGRKCGSLRIVQDVQMILHDDRIESIGAEDDTPVDRFVDAEGGVVMPGLIDPHRHARMHRPSSEGGERPTPIERSLRRALGVGVVGIELKCSEGIAGAGGLAELKAATEDVPVYVWRTLLGWANGGDAQSRSERISALIGDVIPRVKRRHAAAFCDAAVGSTGFSPREAEAILRAGMGAGFHPKTHAVGDGTQAAAAVAVGVGAASIDHVNEVPYRAAKELRRQGVVCVLLPANAFLDGAPQPPARELIDQGLPVALGTDFGAHLDGVESPWVLLSLVVRRLGLSLEEAVAAVTLNAAAALRASADFGSLEAGKRADFLILDMEDYRDIPRCVGASPVRKTFIAGEEVFGT